MGNTKQTSKKPQPLNDLEMFEVMQLAYPEKFPADDDDAFEAAQEFADGISGWDEVADLLGRVARLAMPLRSSLTGELHHALGDVSVKGENFSMVAVVKRPVDREK